MPIRSI